MKKIFLLLAFFIATITFAQTPARHYGGVVLGSFASDPTPVMAGQIYWNTTDNKFRAYNGTAWEDLALVDTNNNFSVNQTFEGDLILGFDSGVIVNSTTTTTTVNQFALIDTTQNFNTNGVEVGDTVTSPFGTALISSIDSNDTLILDTDIDTSDSGITYTIDGDVYGTLTRGTLSELQVWTLPNATGTLALTTDIPTLQQVTTAGNSSTNSMIIQSSAGIQSVFQTFLDTDANQYSSMGYDKVFVKGTSSSLEARTDKIYITAGGIDFTEYKKDEIRALALGTNFGLTLDFNKTGAVSSYTQTFQQAGGTIALTSDITSPDLQTVTNQGSTTTNNVTLDDSRLEVLGGTAIANTTDITQLQLRNDAVINEFTANSKIAFIWQDWKTTSANSQHDNIYSISRNFTDAVNVDVHRGILNYIKENGTGMANQIVGIQNEFHLDPSGTSPNTEYMIGTYNFMQTSNFGATNWTIDEWAGVKNQLQVSDFDLVVTDLYGSETTLFNNGGNVTNFKGVSVETDNEQGGFTNGTITNYYGLYSELNPTSSADITGTLNLLTLEYTDGTSGGITAANPYSIYSSPDIPSYFRGNIEIGNASDILLDDNASGSGASRIQWNANNYIEFDDQATAEVIIKSDNGITLDANVSTLNNEIFVGSGKVHTGGSNGSSTIEQDDLKLTRGISGNPTVQATDGVATHIISFEVNGGSDTTLNTPSGYIGEIAVAHEKSPQNITATPSGSTNTTAGKDFYFATWSGGTGNYTFNLPAVASNQYRCIKIVCDNTITASHTITLDGNGAETIDGATTYVINRGYEAISVWSTGTEWILIQEKK
jgi:hypothetical protein